MVAIADAGAVCRTIVPMHNVRRVRPQKLQSGLMNGVVMRQVSAVEARRGFRRLLDWAESGGAVIITRRGKAVARLVPNIAEVDRAAARRVIKGVFARRRTMTLGGLKIKSLCAEGRR
jgi:prevent-host-death family protein